MRTKHGWVHSWADVQATEASITNLTSGRALTVAQVSVHKDQLIQSFHHGFVLIGSRNSLKFFQKKCGLLKGHIRMEALKSKGTQPLERQESKHLCDTFFTFSTLPLIAESVSVCYLLYPLACQLDISAYLSTLGPKWPGYITGCVWMNHPCDPCSYQVQSGRFTWSVFTWWEMWPGQKTLVIPSKKCLNCDGTKYKIYSYILNISFKVYFPTIVF